MPELILSRLLRKKLVRSRLPGKPDFVYPRAKLAVFVHGCWWHCCPVCNISLPRTNASYWTQKLERNVERDTLNKVELNSLGWKVLEVWEHEVRNSPKATALRITRAVLRR